MSKNLGPAYRSLMMLGQADDLVYEFAPHNIASPGRCPPCQGDLKNGRARHLRSLCEE